jgi:hypothetical protein
MDNSIYSTPKPRSRYFKHYQRAFDRINAHLERTNPELEDQRIQEMIRRLFGIRPSETKFESSGMQTVTTQAIEPEQS